MGITFIKVIPTFEIRLFNTSELSSMENPENNLKN
jgi:hypothetical protein